jgi:cytochrome c peroxidase
MQTSRTPADLSHILGWLTALIPALAGVGLPMATLACSDNQAGTPTNGASDAAQEPPRGEPKEDGGTDGGKSTEAAQAPLDGGTSKNTPGDAADPEGSVGDMALAQDASVTPRGQDASTKDAGEQIDESLLEQLTRPAYPDPIYPAENPDTDAKALLGKILFWEEQMSGDGTMACGTCHRGAAGGSDPRAVALPGPDETSGTDDDIQGSPGIVRCDDSGERIGDMVQFTGRRASNYLDAMFAPNLFWDGRAECRNDACPSESAFEDPDHPGTFPIASGGALENQAVMPPLSDVEMACEGATWDGIHARLATATPLALAHDIPEAMAEFIAQHDASYPAMFEAAFGEEQSSGPADEINTRRIAFAIANHERRLQSKQTPWDAFNAGDRDALTEAQTRGYITFRTKAGCGSCHAPPLFTAHQFHFTGFYEPAWDEGRFAITMDPTDHGKMRTPTLRNVGLRIAGGLLHNGGGRGLSLEAIIDTYAAGGRHDTPAIASVPISPSVTGFELSATEKVELVDFLVNGLTDPRVKDELPPFDRPVLGSED